MVFTYPPYGVVIGDTEVGGIPYSVIVDTAREYINNLGGFGKFAEWGLLRP